MNEISIRKFWMMQNETKRGNFRPAKKKTIHNNKTQRSQTLTNTQRKAMPK